MNTLDPKDVYWVASWTSCPRDGCDGSIHRKFHSAPNNRLRVSASCRLCDFTQWVEFNPDTQQPETIDLPDEQPTKPAAPEANEAINSADWAGHFTFTHATPSALDKFPMFNPGWPEEHRDAWVRACKALMEGGNR